MKREFKIGFLKRQHDLPRFLWIGGITATVLLTWWLLAVPSSHAMPVLCTALLGICVFFLPGYLVRRLLLREDRWPILIEIPMFFALSLGVGLLVWLAARVLGGGLVLFGYLICGAVTVLGVLSIWLCRFESIRTQSSITVGWDSLYLVLLLVPIVFWTIVVFRVGAGYMPHSDNWYYLAVVRRIMVANNLIPGDPFFAGVADAERSGPWLAMVALWVKQGGVDLVALWEVLPAAIMPISLLAFYALAWMLFHDHWIAALVAVLTLAGRTGFTWNEPMMMAAPSNVALLLSFVGLGLGIEYGRKGRASFLVAAVLLAGAVAVQHVLVFAGLLLMLGVFSVAQLGMGLLKTSPGKESSDIRSPIEWRRAGLRLVLLVILSAVLAAPALVFWARGASATTNPIYDDLWGLFKAIGPWHVLRVSSLSGGPHLFAFSFLLLPLLLCLVSRHDWAVFLVAVMALVVLIGFTPPVVEAILRADVLPPWGIWRLVAQIYPFQLTVAALVYWGIKQAWPFVLRLFGGRRWLSFVVLGSILLLGWVPNVTPVAEPLLRYVQLARNGRPMESGMNWLREGPLAALPQDEGPMVVLSDASTSFYISGLTGHYVVAMPYGHASPLVIDDQERRDEVSGALAVGTDLGQMRSLLEKHGVTALVLVEDSELGKDTLSPEAWSYWVDTLKAASGEFELLFYQAGDDRQAAVYLWQPDGREP
jgi:hypothetical protein